MLIIVFTGLLAKLKERKNKGSGLLFLLQTISKWPDFIFLSSVICIYCIWWVWLAVQIPQVFPAARLLLCNHLWYYQIYTIPGPGAKRDAKPRSHHASYRHRLYREMLKRRSPWSFSISKKFMQPQRVPDLQFLPISWPAWRRCLGHTCEEG